MSESTYKPTGLYADPAKVETMRKMDVDAAMWQLHTEGVQHGWFKDYGYTSIEDWKTKDIIGFDEFGGLVERILLSAMK